MVVLSVLQLNLKMWSVVMLLHEERGEQRDLGGKDRSFCCYCFFLWLEQPMSNLISPFSYLVPLSALGQSRALSSDVEQCLMFLKQMLARNLQLFVWECDCFGKQDNFNLGHHIMYLCHYIIFLEMKPQFLYTCTEKHHVVSVMWLLAPLNVHFSVICVEQIIWFPLRTSCVDGRLSLHHDS